MLFDYEGKGISDDQTTNESDSLIMEAAMLDTMDNDDIAMFLENTEEINAAINEDIVTEKTIVRLDKKAKLSKARKAAVFAIAKEKKDKLFNKLVWCWKLERFIEAKLDKKYGNEAARRAKKAMSKSKNSNSNVIKKVASKAHSMFNGSAK